ncbi:MAG: lipoprotein signal peptidase [Bacteroidota bacterium]
MVICTFVSRGALQLLIGTKEITLKSTDLKRSYVIIAIVLLVLLLDQALKVWVKTNMEYGEYFNILGFDWARIHFVENPGMAFGIELGGEYGKLALSLFRIGAVFFLIYYIGQLIKMQVPFGLLVSFALILAGALGNILDSAFYGLLFSESQYHGGLATFMPEEGGYASFLHGRVVDMFHFPLFEGRFPEWVPKWGGQHFEFFRPVFNLADTSITIGVLNILLFQRSFFAAEESENKPIDAAESKEQQRPSTETETAQNDAVGHDEKVTPSNNSDSVSVPPTSDN